MYLLITYLLLCYPTQGTEPIHVWSATWCSPCKALKPELKELEKMGYTVIRHDIDQEQAPRDLKVVPTIYVNKLKIVGFHTAQQIHEKIQRALKPYEHRYFKLRGNCSCPGHVNHALKAL